MLNSSIICCTEDQTGNIPVHSDHELRISIELPAKNHFKVYFVDIKMLRKKVCVLFFLINFFTEQDLV